jgi:teichuronic acid biosynthesis glycosyltransferase TuaG
MSSAVPPLVTIGIAVFNGELTLKESLQSAVEQDFDNLEILILDDGSTDATPSIIASFPDSRITAIRSSKNLGVGKGRHLLKSLAQGDYLTWLDADDIYDKNRVRYLVDWAEKSGADLVSDCYRVMNADGSFQERILRVPEKIARDRYLTRLFERNVMLPHPLMRRSCYQQIDYDPVAHTSEDYDVWLQCSYRGMVYSFLNEPLLYYRLTPNSLSKNHEKSRQMTKYIFSKYLLEDLIRLYRERGYSEGHIQYMLCLQNIFRENYHQALYHAQQPWSDGLEVDQDFYEGTLLLRNGKPSAAREKLERHLANNQRSAAGWNNLGVVTQCLQGDPQSFFRRALETVPGYVDAKLNIESKGRASEYITDTLMRT